MSRGRKVIATCPYVQSYLARHPEDLDIEFLDAVAVEDGQAVALHPLLHLRQRHRFGEGSRGRECDDKCDERGNFSGVRHVGS